MKSTIKIMAALALTLLAGCVVTSVYPFYTARDIAFDPALVGTWVDAGATNSSSERWHFEKFDAQSYKFTLEDGDKKTEFDARLFKLDGRLFIDMTPRERQDDFVPPHYLLKVIRIGPTLEVAPLSYDWLKKLVEKDPKAVRHIVVTEKLGDSGDGRVVLTADTAELQKLILRHEADEGAFDPGPVMRRQ